MNGITLYLGAPGAGKSFLANRRVEEEAAMSGQPVLLIDGAGTSDFGGADLVETWEAAARNLWGAPRRHARIVPAGAEDVEALAGATRAGGDSILYLDEVGLFLTPHAVGPALSRLVRTYRHSRVSVHLTTQYVGDLSPLFLLCADRVFAFCNDRKRAVDRLAEEFGFDPVRLPLLKRGEYLEWGRRL